MKSRLMSKEKIKLRGKITEKKNITLKEKLLNR